MRYSKLNRPKVSPDLLTRPHLIEKLEKHSHLPFILISAPAGYGKTMLISQWLEQRGNNYAWISLDQSMSDSSTFISYFAETLERSTSVEIPELKNLDQGAHLLSWESIIDIIVNKINELKDPIRLILDDYHLISNREIDRLINAIISENIGNFRLVLITRWDPPLQLRELRLYQRMLELRIRDLRFSQDEISELLAREGHVNFSEDEISELLTETEGWILAIRMIVMARALLDLKGNKLEYRIITSDLDVLVDQISDNLDPEFIKRVQLCSLCDQFNEDLIDSIFTHAFNDPGDAGTFLAKLKDLDFFLLPAADNASWFRFHHLLGDIHRRRLERNEPNIIKPVYNHISSWFSGKGLIDDAIRYAIKAENYELACKLITEHQVNILDRGEWWIVRAWLEQIPEPIRKSNLDLLLLEMRICEDTWKLEDISSILSSLESQGIENADSKTRATYLFHKGHYFTFARSDAKEAIECLEQSKKLYENESSFGARRELIMATARQMLGKSTLALKSLEEIERKYEPSSIMHIRSLYARVFVHILSGNMHEASNDAEKFHFIARNCGFKTVEASSLYLRGNIALQAFNEDVAVQSFDSVRCFQGMIKLQIVF